MEKKQVSILRIRLNIIITYKNRIKFYFPCHCLIYTFTKYWIVCNVNHAENCFFIFR